MSDGAKQAVVLARNDPLEAMRVAAGLTIFGHEVELIFMTRALTAEEADSEHGELLELCDIVPQTTVADMAEHFNKLDQASLASLLKDAEMVVNL